METHREVVYIHRTATSEPTEKDINKGWESSSKQERLQFSTAEKKIDFSIKPPGV